MSPWIRAVTVNPIGESIDPRVKVIAFVNYAPGREAPIAAIATLTSEAGKRVGTPSHALVNSGSAGFPLDVLRNPAPAIQPVENQLEFQFGLTPTELAHLEDCRNKNRKHDLVLNLIVRLTFLQPMATLHDVTYIEEVRNRSGYGGSEEKRMYLAAWAPSDKSKGGSGLLTPGGMGSSLLCVITEELKGAATVPSSDWTADFIPALRLGSFLVLEIPEIEGLPATGELKERLSRARRASDQMRKDLSEGEWNECVKHSRDVWDLTRDEAALKPVLVESGLSEPAVDELLAGLRGLFNFASKYLKPIEAGSRTLNPVLSADKEDAYFVYALSAASLNLVARKAFKSGG
ncbi:MAG: hypothetical protein ACHQ2Y_02340 [Candidatus Lutacidiplasmatales archaeon]